MDQGSENQAFYVVILGWIILTAKWTWDKLPKSDFKEFRKEYREDQIRLYDLIEKRTIIERRKRGNKSDS